MKRKWKSAQEKYNRKLKKKNEQKDKLRMNPRNAFFMGGKKTKNNDISKQMRKGMWGVEG